jgi:hypothetical protein
MTVLRACLFAALALLASGARAEEAQVVDVTMAVEGHDGVSYFDLMKQVMPDLVLTDGKASGRNIAGLRHILGPPFAGKPVDAITLGRIEMRRFKAEGEERIALLTNLVRAPEFAEAPALLAIFDEAATPRLMDLLDVGMDMETAFAEAGPVPIGRNDEAFVTSSWRVKGDKVQWADALMFMRDGKLELIDIYFRLDETLCGFKRTQRIKVENLIRLPGAPYDDVKVTMTDARFVADTNCTESHSEPPFSHSVSNVYRWTDAGSFIVDEDLIRGMEDETSARL